LYNIIIESGIPMKVVRLIKMCLNETYTRGVHKVSFPLGPQVANLILSEATACT
jgi:hypothetical protein